jgi:hypothetical protein
MRLLPLLILLGGCAASGTQSESREQRDLTEELAGRTAGRPERCIPANQGQALRIVDRRTLVYRQGSTIWVNRLDAPCSGLRPLSTLIVDVHGSQYCSGDRVRGLEPGSGIAGPSCPLRDFVPYRKPR